MNCFGYSNAVRLKMREEGGCVCVNSMDREHFTEKTFKQKAEGKENVKE